MFLSLARKPLVETLHSHSRLQDGVFVSSLPTFLSSPQRQCQQLAGIRGTQIGVLGDPRPGELEVPRVLRDGAAGTGGDAVKQADPSQESPFPGVGPGETVPRVKAVTEVLSLQDCQ